MDDRDDLGDIWGQHEQDAYESAQARNMATIESFAITPMRGGKRGAPTPPPAPCVPLYEWHRYCYSNYMNEKMRAFEEDDAGNDANDGDDSSSDVSESDADSDISMPSHHSGDESGQEDLLMQLTHGDLRKRKRQSETFVDSRPKKKGKKNQQQQRNTGTIIQPWMQVPHHEECCMCGFGDEFHDALEAPEMNDLIRIYQKGFAMCSDLTLAQALHLHFMEHIHPLHPNVPILTVRIALQHIEDSHTLDATNYVCEKIRTSKRLEFLLSNAIYREDGTYDEKTLKNYNKQVEATCKLYNQQPRKMMFHFDRSKDDMRAASNFLNVIAPMKKQSTQQRQQQHRMASHGRPAFTL